MTTDADHSEMEPTEGSTSDLALLRRRDVAAALAAFGGYGLLTARSAWGQAGPNRVALNAIDVHRHFTPPFLVAGQGRPWNMAQSIDDMDQSGIAKAVLSAPTQLGENDARGSQLVRQVNEFGAQLVRDHPTRFGFYTALPMPDVEASLREIAYGLDALKACGVGFATSYGAIYASDPLFEPIWEELNRRKAIAYFHPLVGACCNALVAGAPQETTWLEIPYDTGRVVLGFLLRGTFAKYRDIKWFFSHSGGPIPMLAGRIKNLSAAADLSKIAPDGILAEFQRLYYETGNANSPPTLAALLKFVPLGQVMFGTDHPFVSGAANIADLQRAGLTAAQKSAILHGNAQRLIPTL